MLVGDVPKHQGETGLHAAGPFPHGACRTDCLPTDYLARRDHITDECLAECLESCQCVNEPHNYSVCGSRFEW